MKVKAMLLATCAAFLTVAGTSQAWSQAGRVKVTKTVSVVNFAFQPARLSITKGTTVKWMNNSTSTHTTTSNTGLWNATLAPGKSFSRLFSTAGSFAYHCAIHTFMKGTITVTG